MSKVLMVASEATPFAKTGGLADVVGSLPAALQRAGDEVAVLMPRYRGVSLQDARRVYNDLEIWMGHVCYRCDVHLVHHREVPYYLLDHAPLYDREGLYGDRTADHPDNDVRFAVLAKAALGVARRLFRPDVIHCHDWQTAMAPFYARRYYELDPTFYAIRFLLTIHNLGYQGRFGLDSLPRIGLGGEDVRYPDPLEFYGDINYLKAGIAYSDAVTTVSKGYAREIQTPEFGFGLDGILRERSDSLFGILNGVDYSEWDPATDPLLPAHYSAEELDGKQACKRALLEEFGLPSKNLDRPVIGIVSRFASQKGFDLLEQVSSLLAAEDVLIVALGAGEAKYEIMFQELAVMNPQKIAVRIAYDNRLAHLIEAGSDMFLMPSRYEPCGLNQIFSLKYGTIPVVRATGGLDDTIDTGTGFKFWEYSGEALIEAIRAALAAYQERREWTAMMKRAMAKDFSWAVSAAEYSALYRKLAGTPVRAEVQTAARV
ncbi:MAG: glycogen synthase GlgA [Bryobacteraceae bacterium]